MVFYQHTHKTEAQLPNRSSEGDKAPVVAHGQPSLQKTRMQSHDSPKEIDFGRRAVQTMNTGGSGATVNEVTIRGVPS